MPATTTGWCPSLDHKPARLKRDAEAGFHRCPSCGLRYAACLVRSRPELFREPVAGVRPGYDPVTGTEAQDLPR